MSKVILIDNGHGQDTKGKRSPDGLLMEWAFTRIIAERVAARMKALGIDARIIVPEKWDVSLTERVRRVNTVCRQVGAANVALVSIHVNAAGSDGNGTMPADSRCGWQRRAAKNQRGWRASCTTRPNAAT